MLVNGAIALLLELRGTKKEHEPAPPPPIGGEMRPGFHLLFTIVSGLNLDSLPPAFCQDDVVFR